MRDTLVKRDTVVKPVVKSHLIEKARRLKVVRLLIIVLYRERQRHTTHARTRAREHTHNVEEGETTGLEYVFGDAT